MDIRKLFANLLRSRANQRKPMTLAEYHIARQRQLRVAPMRPVGEVPPDYGTEPLDKTLREPRRYTQDEIDQARRDAERYNRIRDRYKNRG